MFKRPIVFIAVVYAVFIIFLRPVIPVHEKSYHDKQEIPVISAISGRFVSVIQETMPHPYDALLSSIVFGGGLSPLDPDLKEKYKKAGLAHLLVASGTQVSILIGVCLAIVRFFKIPLNLGIFFASLFNIIFALMAGCGPSIIRAAIMGQVALLGKLFNRDSEIYTALSLAALVMMIFDPLVIFDIGFQLSFSATWALVYFCPVLEKRGIPGVVAISLAPILATLPIVFYNFNQISLVSLPVNVLVVPWVEMITVAGFASTLFGVFLLPAAQTVNFFLFLVLKILNGIVYTFSSISWGCVYLKQPSFVFICVYYGLLVYTAEFLREKKMFKLSRQNVFIAVLAFIAVFVWHTALSPNVVFAQNELQISVVDVKQGDSIFVKSPEGKTMLIDGGPKFRKGDAGKRFVLPFLHKQGINKLDVVVLTHPHDDHVGGLPSVLSEMPVGLVMDSGQIHTSKGYMDFLRIVDQKQIPYKIARKGVSIGLGIGRSEVKAKVLNPEEPLIEKSALNNNSIVLMLTYGEFSMLLMGDAEEEAEARILKNTELGTQITAIKIGHHGSKTSSSQDLLDIIKPTLALISVGAKNVYHHPHPSMLKRLEEKNVKIYRTDINGTVTIKTDGKKYIVETEKN